MAKISQNKIPNERDFQTWFKNHYNGWLCQLHPGQGSDVGIPDLLLGTPSAGLIGCEVKCGSLIDGVVWCSAIRPAQIRFHTSLANAGHSSILAIGVWSGDHWRPFLVDGSLCRQWDSEGFLAGEIAIEIHPDQLASDVADFVYDELGE